MTVNVEELKESHKVEGIVLITSIVGFKEDGERQHGFHSWKRPILGVLTSVS